MTWLRDDERIRRADLVRRGCWDHTWVTHEDGRVFFVSSAQLTPSATQVDLRDVDGQLHATTDLGKIARVVRVNGGGETDELHAPGNGTTV